MASMYRWRGAISKMSILILIAGLTCWQSSTANIDSDHWLALPCWDRFKIYIGVLIVCLNTAKAFIEKPAETPPPIPKP